MNNTYYVLQSVAKFQFKEKGSKLIAHAIPVATQEAKQPLAELRKKYYDATHYCYTYTVGYRQVVTRKSNNGEPSSSGRMPIENQIWAKGVQNTLVVLARYYGGRN